VPERRQAQARAMTRRKSFPHDKPQGCSCTYYPAPIPRATRFADPACKLHPKPAKKDLKI